MPFALAIAHREIARLDEAGTPERQEHVEQARTLFRKCGAVQDAERLDEIFSVTEPAVVGA
jgi:hypothetical protein